MGATRKKNRVNKSKATAKARSHFDRRWAFIHSRFIRSLSPTALRVYDIVDGHAHQTAEAWCSVETIAEMLLGGRKGQPMSERHVREALKELRDAGLIVLVHRGGGRVGNVNVWRIADLGDPDGAVKTPGRRASSDGKKDARLPTQRRPSSDTKTPVFRHKDARKTGGEYTQNVSEPHEHNTGSRSGGVPAAPPPEAAPQACSGVDDDNLARIAASNNGDASVIRRLERHGLDKAAALVREEGRERCTDLADYLDLRCKAAGKKRLPRLARWLYANLDEVDFSALYRHRDARRDDWTQGDLEDYEPADDDGDDANFEDDEPTPPRTRLKTRAEHKKRKAVEGDGKYRRPPTAEERDDPDAADWDLMAARHNRQRNRKK